MIKMSLILLMAYMLVFFIYLKLISIIYSEKLKKKWPFLVGLIVPIIVAFVFSKMDNEGKVVVVYATSIVAFFLMTFGTFREKVGKTLEMFFLTECLNGIISFIFEICGLASYMNRIEAEFSFVLQHTVLFVVLCIVELLKQKNRLRWRKFWNRLTKQLYYWIIIMVISMNITVAGLNFAKDYVNNAKFAVLATWLCVITYISVGMLSMFVFYIKRTNEHIEKMLQQETLAKNMQKYYYEELLEREEDTRKYRHDMVNHLICINSLAKEKDYESLMDYVQKMQKQMNQIQKKIYTVGNQILDIVTNYYLNMLSPEITIKISGNVYGQLYIDSDALCTIYANLMNNAVEELSKANKGYISIEFTKGEEYFQIIVENSLSLASKNKDNLLLTEKEDKKNHGLGLNNVRKTVEENNGKIDIIYDKQKFKATVTLKNK